MLLGKKLLLIQKKPEKFQDHLTGSNVEEIVVSKRNARVRSQIVGRANPIRKNLEFENEISRWSTSSIPDDCELPPAQRTDSDTRIENIAEADRTIKFEQRSVRTDPQPVIHSKTAQMSKAMSPFTSVRKNMVKTLPARLYKPARSFLLQLTPSGYEDPVTPENLENDVVTKQNQRHTRNCIDSCAESEQSRSPSKPIGLWGYRARHLQRSALDPAFEERFCNRNWRHRIHLAALFIQCSFRMHTAKKKILHRKIQFKLKSQLEEAAELERVCRRAAERFSSSLHSIRACLCAGRISQASRLISESQNDLLISEGRVGEEERSLFFFLQAIAERRQEEASIEATGLWGPMEEGRFQVASGRFVRGSGVPGVLRLLDPEQAQEDALALGQLMCCVRDALSKPAREEAAHDGGAELIAAALRRHKYDAAAAADMLERYAALMRDLGVPHDSVRGLAAGDVAALGAEHGLRTLPDADGAPAPDGGGGIILAIDAARLFDRDRGSSGEGGRAETAAVGRLVLFLRVSLAERPELALRGVTVAVDLTRADPRRSFSYGFAATAHRLVSSFPMPLRRLVLFGPAANIGTGWHTALRLLTPSIGDRVVYAPVDAAAAMTAAALTPYLSLSVTSRSEIAGLPAKRRPASAASRCEDSGIRPPPRPASAASATGEESDRCPAGDAADVITEEHNLAQQALVWNPDFGLGWYDPPGADARARLAASALRNLGRNGGASKSIGRPEDVLPAVAVLKAGSIKARVSAARLLAAVCRARHAGGKVALAKCEGARWLAWMLNGSDQGERAAAADALASGCTYNAASAAVAQRAGAVPRLLDLLDGCDAGCAQRGLAEALASVCENDNESGAGKDVYRSGVYRVLALLASCGQDEVQRCCFAALAAALNHVEMARREFLQSHAGPDSISRSLLYGGPLARRGAAQTVAALCRDIDDRFQAARLLQQLGAIPPLVEQVSSFDPAAEADGSNALAACCQASDDCARDLMRHGGVHVLARACTRTAALSKILFSCRPGDNQAAEMATKVVGSVYEEWICEKAAGEVSETYLDSCINFLDPCMEGMVVPIDWSNVQCCHLRVFSVLLRNECSREDTAEQLCHIHGIFSVFSELACCEDVGVQGAAFSVLTELAKIQRVCSRVVSEFLDKGGDKVLIDVINRADCNIRLALDCLLQLSEASAHFRGRIGCTGVLKSISSISTNRQKTAKFSEEVVSSAQQVINFFSKGDAGLFYMMRNGSQSSQEKAAAAVWHLSVHNPEMKSSFIEVQNLGLLENIANSIQLPPPIYKGHIPAELTAGATNPSRLARRSALNALKTLGRLPMDYDAGVLEVQKPKPISKSKLRGFREYLQRQEAITLKVHELVPSTANTVSCSPDLDLWNREPKWK